MRRCAPSSYLLIAKPSFIASVLLILGAHPPAHLISTSRRTAHRGVVQNIVKSVLLNPKCRKPFQVWKTHGDTTMKKLLTFQDLLSILQVSEATLRRWLAETRAGRGNFPKPITGFKRKLLFHPDDIERWTGCQQQPTPIVKVESASRRTQRHNAAIASLRAKGVKVASKQQQDKST